MTIPANTPVKSCTWKSPQGQVESNVEGFSFNDWSYTMPTMPNTALARLMAMNPIVLSIFRIVFGFLFTVHGTSKLFSWPVDGGAIPLGSWPMWWAGVIETVCGLLIMLGLFTRAAAFVASGHMAVTYFWQHQPGALWPTDPNNGGELAVMYCFGFLLLVVAGGGTLALDALRDRTKPPAPVAPVPTV